MAGCDTVLQKGSDNREGTGESVIRQGRTATGARLRHTHPLPMATQDFNLCEQRNTLMFSGKPNLACKAKMRGSAARGRGRGTSTAYCVLRTENILVCCYCVGSDRMVGVCGVLQALDLVRDDGMPCLR